MSVLTNKHNDVIFLCVQLQKENTLGSHKLLIRTSRHWIELIEGLINGLREKSRKHEYALEKIKELEEIALCLIHFTRASLKWLLDYHDCTNSSK